MLKELFFIFCFFIFSIVLSGQNSDKFKNINWWIYHQLNFGDFVDINSEDWKNLSLIEKKELMQIPESELKIMSTKALIESYINCAQARSFFLFSELDDYYKHLSQGFNGVDELINRADAVNEIIKYYIEMNPKDVTVNRSGVSMSFQIQFLEYLIGNPKFINKFDMQQLHIIASELINKYQAKIKIQPVVVEAIESNLYAISRVLYRSETGKQKELSVIEDIDFLSKSGRIKDEVIASEVINLINEFVGN